MFFLDALQKAVKSGDISGEHLLVKNTENIIKTILNGEPQKLYDSMTPSGRKMLLSFQDASWSVKVKDESDTEDIYIKGVLDGMRAYLVMISIFVEVDKKREEKNDEKI